MTKKRINIEAIDACLPQTQCGECGYPGCRPYAAAIVHGEAKIDACPPGGVDTLYALAKALELDAAPYEKTVRKNTRSPKTAIIREAECIGCTKCLPACPVDAIIGSAKQLHHVIPNECTGCGLCVEPCPVDCIDLVNIPKAAYTPDIARSRHEAKQLRVLQKAQTKERTYQAKRHLNQTDNPSNQADKAAKRAYILDALKRSQKK